MVDQLVIFDAERMKYPHTGLYHFCLQLGKAIKHHKQSFTGFNVGYYLPEAEGKIFGEDVFYLPHHPLHKFYRFQKKKIKLWHCTFQGSNYIPRNRNIKVLLTVHDINFIHENNTDEKRKRRLLMRLQKKLDRADYITVISKFTLHELKRYLDISNKPVSVIYNGCNVSDATVLQLPALLPSKPFLFTIGTITSKKNFHVLPCLLTDNDWQLLIAGITLDENYKNKIMEEAVKWNVQDRIFFTGSVSENDKAWYYQHCKAFVFPSVAEGFGLPVVEAMHFGVPVFLSSLTSLPEIGGKAAYYFQHFDAVYMQQQLRAGLTDYDSNKIWKQQQLKQQSEQFSWSKAARKYLELYSHLIHTD